MSRAIEQTTHEGFLRRVIQETAGRIKHGTPNQDDWTRRRKDWERRPGLEDAGRRLAATGAAAGWASDPAACEQDANEPGK